MSTREKTEYVLPITLVVIAGAFLLAVVYGYPHLFMRIEASSPAHYETIVPEAIAAGDFDTALTIARRRTEQYRFDPMTYTVYGRALLAAGQTDDGLAQLNKATDLDRIVRQTASQATVDSAQRSYYFAPARLSLGEFYLRTGKLAEALENFELARDYAVPADKAFADFHDALFKAYAAAGMWSRAVEFSEPLDRVWDTLDAAQLRSIAEVCEARRNWELGKRVADRLLTLGPDAGDAEYLLGRIDYEQGNHAASASHLERAVSNGFHRAAYYLGAALEKSGQSTEAIQAYLKTPSDSLYRTFALGKALQLLNSAQQGAPQAAASQQELLTELDNRIAQLRALKHPLAFDTFGRFSLVAAMTSENGEVVSGPCFPIVTLWQDNKAAEGDAARVSVTESDSSNGLVLRKGPNIALQLERVENRINWASVTHLPKGSDVIPGWTDTARDWFELRPDRATHIEADNAGTPYLNIEKTTWFYSVSFPVRHGVGYLLAGRCRESQEKSCMGWQSMDGAENILYQNNVLKDEKLGAWDWYAGYMRSRLEWDSMRVQLNAVCQAGPVSFGDVMLVELHEPEPIL